MILHCSIFSHHPDRLTSHDPTIVPNCTIAAEQLRPPYSFHGVSTQSNQRCCGRLVQALDTVVGRLSTKDLLHLEHAQVTADPLTELQDNSS
jgi:hypothetical protein